MDGKKGIIKKAPTPVAIDIRALYGIIIDGRKFSEQEILEIFMDNDVLIYDGISGHSPIFLDGSKVTVYDVNKLTAEEREKLEELVKKCAK